MKNLEKAKELMAKRRGDVMVREESGKLVYSHQGKDLVTYFPGSVTYQCCGTGDVKVLCDEGEVLGHLADSVAGMCPEKKEEKKKAEEKPKRMEPSSPTV